MDEGRVSEAQAILQRALAWDPRNPYTLNNMGVVQEMEGDFDQALKYYTAVAETHSTEPVIVTLNRKWRGKPISDGSSRQRKESAPASSN